MTDAATKIVKRLGELKSLRSQHEDVWRRCFRYTYPVRGSGFYGETMTAEQAQQERNDLCDSTATEAVRNLASNIMSGLTPSNSLWFELDAGQESDQERRWLDNAARFIWENIHASNFDADAYEGTIDGICAGWFVLFIDEKDEGGYSFAQWPIAECYLASTRTDGYNDTLYRAFKLTAEQAIAFYGKENLSDDLVKTAEKRPDDYFEFVQAIYPRGTYVVNAKSSKNMKFASCHVEVKSQKLVRESGYHEQPFVAPRWMKVPQSAYAMGPVSDALPDVATVNEMRRMELANLDMQLCGMYVAEDDGVLNPRTIKIGPRKIIVANSVESIKELKTSSNFDVAIVSEERIQAQIRKILLADQLQPQDGPAMTATEVHARIQMIRQLLGPIYGRLQAEYLQPLIDRCFGIALRAGVLGPVPESLANRDYTIKYTSPLARAQKLEEVAAIDQYVAGLVEVATATQDASVLDNVDLDEAARYRGEALGVPSSVIPDRDAVAEKRAQRAEQQQAAMEQAQAMQLQQTAGEAVIKKATA
jgi:hypothetical protein